MLTNPCTLCAEFAGETEGNLFRAYYQSFRPTSRVVDQTEHFFAIPSLGPIVEGHLLICTRGHYFSVGAALLRKPELLSELRSFKEKIQTKLQDMYGCKSIAFEHGAGSFTNRAGSCTDHAHIHVVPAEIDLMAQLLRIGGLRWERTTFPELARYAVDGNAYLYYEDMLGTGLCAIASRYVPSQMFRRMLSTALRQREGWDWRQNPELAKVLRVIRRFAYEPTIARESSTVTGA